jgi:hypothetical protein
MFIFFPPQIQKILTQSRKEAKKQRRKVVLENKVWLLSGYKKG